MADQTADVEADDVEHRLAARPAVRRMGAQPGSRAARSSETLRGMFGSRHELPGPRLQGRRGGAARRRDVLVVDQRRAHRPVHGRPDPRHERPRAPHVPQPRREGVPRVAARALGRHARAARSSTGCSTTIAPLGRADLVASITSVYPVQVICGIAGVPLEDAAQFARWAEQINMGPLAPEEGMAASQAMVDYLRPLVEARRGRIPPATSSPTSCTRRSTASSSPTRRSTASCDCCCRPARRRRSA